MIDDFQSMEEAIFAKAETCSELRSKLLEYADALHRGAMEEGSLLLFIEAETLRERVFDLEHEAKVRMKMLGPAA